MNGPASQKVIAQQIDKTARGQNWSDPWSTTGYCGFIEKADEPGKHQITDRGRRFVGDDAADSTAAAQEGLMETGFGPVIERFGSGAPNIRAIAGVLVEDHSVPEKSGEKVAQLLVEMATECELIVDGRWDAAAIEQAIERVGELMVTPARAQKQQTKARRDPPPTNGGSDPRRGATRTQSPRG